MLSVAMTTVGLTERRFMAIIQQEHCFLIFMGKKSFSQQIRIENCCIVTVNTAAALGTLFTAMKSDSSSALSFRDDGPGVVWIRGC